MSKKRLSAHFVTPKSFLLNKGKDIVFIFYDTKVIFLACLVAALLLALKRQS
jgi:hypothetical protein